MKLTGADIFVQVLIEQGVDTMFGYPPVEVPMMEVDENA